MIDINRDDFFTKEVIRTNGVSEIIFDYYMGKPVRLIGFKTESDLPDIDVLIEGYNYFERLVEEIQK